MNHKAINVLLDIAIASGGVGTIWGISLADWDHITRIGMTLAVGCVSITLALLHHRRKK